MTNEIRKKQHALDTIRTTLIYNPGIEDHESAAETIYTDLERDPEAKQLIESAGLNKARGNKLLNGSLAAFVGAMGIFVIGGLARKYGFTDEKHLVERIAVLSGVSSIIIGGASFIAGQVYDAVADAKVRATRKYISAETINELYRERE